MNAPNHFLQFWQHGYRRIVPVIPAGARAPPALTPGKTPGELNGDGSWHGLTGWQHLHPTEADMIRWHRMGANVGLRCGDGTGLLGIDADTLDVATAAIIKEKVTAALGVLPERIGQAPKALFLCRVDPEYEHPTIDFNAGHVEVRTYSQFVAAGTHAKTLKPYQWPVAPLPYDKLPLIDSVCLDALWAEIRDALPGGVFTSDPEGKEAVPGNRDGDPVLIKRAVEAIPNDYSDRRIYIKMAAWLKSNHPDTAAAFDLFRKWCDDWSQDNDEAIVLKDWNSLTAPYKVGKNWGYRTATLRNPELCPPLWHLFETLVAAAPSTGLERINTEIRSTPFDFAAAAAVGPRESLYGGHYIRQFLSSTIAPSKVGKSSLIICEALAMASGKPLLGVQPAGALRVWMWNGEDPMEELQRRIIACMRLYGLAPEDIGDRLFIDSGRKMPIVLATQTKAGAMIAEPVEKAVIATILENKIDVFQVDPFISSHRVSENDNNAIDVVAKRWGYCADVTRCAIEIPHHSRKLNGMEVSVEDGRGASALLAAVRSSRALARMTVQEAEKAGLQDVARRLFRFTEVSSNLSIPASESQQWMELASVNLNNGIGDDMDKVIKGDSVGVVRLFDAPAARETALRVATGGDDAASRERAALAAVRAYEWRNSPKADDWVGIPIAQALGIDRGTKEGAKQVAAIIESWLKNGKLAEENRRNKARQVKVYIVAPEQTVMGLDDFFT